MTIPCFDNSPSTLCRRLVLKDNVAHHWLDARPVCRYQQPTSRILLKRRSRHGQGKVCRRHMPYAVLHVYQRNNVSLIYWRTVPMPGAPPDSKVRYQTPVKEKDLNLGISCNGESDALSPEVREVNPDSCVPWGCLYFYDFSCFSWSINPNSRTYTSRADQ